MITRIGTELSGFRDILFVIAASASLIGGCALGSRPKPEPDRIPELWVEPFDLGKRDLYAGPDGGKPPDATDKFEFVAMKQTGYNPGYDVKDSHGQEWSVKIGNESRVEVTISRIMWAIGYHQPYNYYVRSWTLRRDGRDTVIAGIGSRFRMESASEDKKGEWSWRKNPFTGTRPLAGLAVLMVMMNNWDIKTEQNSLYEVTQDNGDTSYRYMVRDVGAAMGKSGWLMAGSKDEIDDFEKEPFIRNIEGNRVYFHYKGATMEPHFLDRITPADVRWISGLLARLSEKQWRDAFRAGGYSDDEAARRIAVFKAKIAEGLRAGMS
jgi:hypothetical protein